VTTDQGDAVWERLRRTTTARIGLGRAGDALPTRRLLEFDAAHALARDAVHAPFDPDLVAGELAGVETVRVASAAPDRATYLQRPDLGRRLAEESAQRLVRGDWDLAVVVADGLSSRAVHTHAAPVVRALLDRLDGWVVAPVVLASQARVALGDEVAERLGARAVVVLVGERPGLSAADSLGAYLTHAPRVGRVDSERNCVSNIRPPHGVAHDAAAWKIALLLAEARRRGLSGVALKDDFPAALPGPGEKVALPAGPAAG